MRRVIATALLLFVALACTTVGNKFDPSRAEQLTPGTSSIEDATNLLGAPSSETNLADGTKLLQWQYVQGTALGTGSGAHVAILFDATGKMIRLAHRSKQNVR
jgi:hypothetical protein